MTKLLLHVCCGPCTTATLEWLRREVAKEVTGFFYNPNIHPVAEYRLRREAMAKVGELMELPLIWKGEEKGLPEYLCQVKPQDAERCRACYTMRLTQAAQTAATENYDAFSTTLLISPYQNLDAIKAVGDALSKQWGPDFIFQDLRHIYPRSRQLAKEWGLYRQKYCGCVVSEIERIAKSK
jgi:epoxyqueuosine reductase